MSVGPIEHQGAGSWATIVAVAVVPLVGVVVMVIKAAAPRAVDQWLNRQTVVKLQQEQIMALRKEVDRLRSEVGQLMEQRLRDHEKIAKLEAKISVHEAAGIDPSGRGSA